MIQWNVENQIDSIEKFDKYICFGSYEYNENIRKGKFLINSNDTLFYINTSGTFDIKINDNIYIANSSDILLLNGESFYNFLDNADSYTDKDDKSSKMDMENQYMDYKIDRKISENNFDVENHVNRKLNKQQKIRCSRSFNFFEIPTNQVKIKKQITKSINTMISIKENMIISNTKGEIESYTLDLRKLDTKKISNEILWTCCMNDIILSGGDSMILYILSPELDIINSIKLDDIITSTNIFNDLIVVTTYSKIYIMEKRNYKILNEVNQGAWRIKPINDYYIGCCYEGVFKYKNDIEFLYKTKSVSYGLLVDNGIYFSSFYEKLVFFIET